MSWAFAVFAIFFTLFFFVFSFFLYVYHREYDREERIVADLQKAREMQSKIDLIYLPIEKVPQAKNPKSQERTDVIDVDLSKKKNIN
jgi:hypothetical protein